MLEFLKNQLLTGSPPHWQQGLALVAYALLEWYLPKSRFKANSSLEALANALKPVLGRVPLVGFVLSKMSSQEPAPQEEAK